MLDLGKVGRVQSLWPILRLRVAWLRWDIGRSDFGDDGGSPT